MLVGFTSGLLVLFARQFGEGNHQKNADLLACFSVLLAAVFTAGDTCTSGRFDSGAAARYTNCIKSIHGSVT